MLVPHDYMTKVKNPVIFFYNGIGDTFFCLPALRALTQLFNGKAILVCPANHENWWFNELLVQQIIKIDAKCTNQGFEFDANALHQKIPDCDIFFSMVSWLSPSLIALMKLWRAKLSVGYFHNYDIFISSLMTKNSFVSNFDCVKIFDPSLHLVDFSHPPIFPEDALATAKLFLDTIVSNDRKILSVHMETKKNKMWTLSKLSRFLDIFLEKHKDYVVLILSLSPMPIRLAKNKDRLVPVFGFNLAFKSALLSLSDLFLGVDSCLLHLADLLRIPGVGLFGPTDPKRFGFYFSQHIHLNPHEKVSKI
jgi:ADP-heptose:LPS heptosyltransferase